MKKIVTVFTAALLCSAASAYAAEMDNTTMPTDAQRMEHMQMMVDQKMKLMDTDGDGKVSRAEYDAFNDKMFKNMDVNADGMLTKEEMVSGMKKEWGMMHEAANSGTTMIVAPADTVSVTTMEKDGTLRSEGNMPTGVTKGVTNDNSGNAMPTTR